MTSTIPLTAAAKVPDYFSIAENGRVSPQEEADTVSAVMSLESISSQGELHQTTVWQTFIHLTKGYVGVGVLSLPWAISQLGIPLGVIGTFVMAYWSSYNCWTVVRLKRFIEQTQTAVEPEQANSEIEGSTVTSVTYPDVGEWAYGRTFHSYVTVCICVQQLAVCTVFLSFIGENLAAVLEFLGLTTSHVAVISMALPAVVALSFLPNLKTLAPVMAAATVTVLIGFGVIGIILHEEWSERPDVLPTMHLPQVPLALCAVLYSYEGICLILPVESAMKEPKYFGYVFWTSMTVVAFIFASFGAICVYVFGNVTNGSITAFLLQAYGDNESILWWIMVANAAVSLSILLTYPLQMFPALELVGPWIQQKMRKGDDVADEKDLAAFDPLPPLFEHQATTEFEAIAEHDYNAVGDDESGEEEQSVLTRITTSIFPTFTMPGDSPLMRVSLVLLTYLVAVVVPNVQSLISLAGALAGSSTALLIPPILELAYLKYLEKEDDTKRSTGIPRDKWFYERVKCYILLFLGMVFCVIGTGASLRDIIRIYRGGAS